MSTRQLHQFVVYAPDCTDPEAFQRRLSVRPKHFERLLTVSEAKWGGAMITPESLEPGAEKKMVGSFMLFEAESVEEVKKIIENDPYYAANVWDKEKLVISPFMDANIAALRKA